MGFFGGDGVGWRVIGVFVFEIGIEELVVVQGEGMAGGVFIEGGFFELF